MMVGDLEKHEQWCLRVPLRKGEELRRALSDDGVVDRTLKPHVDAGDLLIPIIYWREGAQRCTFDPNPGRPPLPRHEMIGGIAVMQDCDREGAAMILASRPSLHTVLCPLGDVNGEYRTRNYEILAGTPSTGTEVTEYGHRFAVDLSAAYFSPRLATERARVASLVGAGESVLDMFAGVGPFAITLAEHASLVVAVDINPRAVGLMLENCVKNRVRNVLPILMDIRHFAGAIPWQFDRIVMNLPKSAELFLPYGFRVCKTGGMIHLYALVSEEGEYRDQITRLGGNVAAERVVRSYSPSQWHAVYDIRKDGE